MPILGTQASQNTKSFLGFAADYLVVAGGGGGGGVAGSSLAAGGGGAGGYRTSIGNSPLTLDFDTSYTVTVGAGGTNGTGGSGGGSGTRGTNGSNSVFGSITSSGGGVGASRYSKQFSIIIAEISLATPPNNVSSCKMITLLVFLTEA